MAECDGVKFRVQMKRGDRIYTGVAETMQMAMAQMIQTIRLRPHETDLEVMVNNFREVEKQCVEVNREIGPLMDLLEKLEGLPDP
jgi:hypothetical protein